MACIYVIEDDENIRDLIHITLKGFGYTTFAFETAEEALASMNGDHPDLFVVDWMLPGMDGLEAIRKIRQDEVFHNALIIMLTAKDRELDKVQGLDEGADDYMTKPFGILELAARIRSLLRRLDQQEEHGESVVASSPGTDQEPMEGLVINKDTREVFFNGKAIPLTYKEFELLQYLVANRKRVVGRDELLNSIWGYTYEGETRTLDIHIRTLRQKLGEEGAAAIKTVRGVGYRYVG